jgi:hypothetical protein
MRVLVLVMISLVLLCVLLLLLWLLLLLLLGLLLLGRWYRDRLRFGRALYDLTVREPSCVRGGDRSGNMNNVVHAGR